MESSYPIASPEELLQHRDFLSGLVRSLVFDHEQAEDYLQETWAYAIRKPPRSGPGLRAWLAVVARNFIRQDRRARMRRDRRETAAAKPEPTPSTEDAVAREHARRRVVDAVLELAEPYRTAVVLRYLEDLPPREIAARTGAPVETVRTRLKRALAQLRTRFDDEHQGDRRAWCAALLPLIDHREVAAGGAGAGLLGGLLLMGAKPKIVAAVVLLALVAGVAFFAFPPGDGREESPDRPKDIASGPGEKTSPEPLPPTPADENAAGGEEPEAAAPAAQVSLAFTDEDGRALSRDEVTRRYAAAGIPLVVRVVPERHFTGKEISDLLRTRIEPPDRWSAEIAVVTLEEGLGLAEPPEPGRYRLFVGRPGAAPMTTATLTVGADGEVGVTIPLPGNAETTAYRLTDADTGAPLAGATVTPWFEYGDDQLFIPGPALTADDQGRLELPSLEDAVRGRGRQPVWWVETETHLGRVTGSVEEVRVSRFGVVEGEAWLSSGEPAVGKLVCWMGKGRTSSTVVGEDGRFRLAPVAVGLRGGTVRIGLIEDLAAFKFREVRVELKAGATKEVTIGEPSGQSTNAVLSGTITAGGKPVPGAFIVVTAEGSGKEFVQTGPDGSFEKDDVKPGQVQLRIYFGDPRAVDDFYAVLGERLTLAAGNEKRFDLDLPAGVFRVTVVDAETGEPVQGAITLGRPENRESGTDRFPGFTYRPGWGLRTGEDGTALLPAMLPGEPHLLLAVAEGYEKLEVKGHLPGTAESPEEVTLRLVKKK